MKEFAAWLATTSASVLIQKNEAWVIPAIQSIHIIGISVVLACVLMMTLRVIGVSGGDRTLLQTQRRFGPWLMGALLVLLLTGTTLVVGEPERELLSFSFWLKMILVAGGTCLAAWFAHSLRRHEPVWESVIVHRAWVRALAALALLLWVAIIFLGRFIAYDHIWGSLSGSRA
jgi:hypothetical protein